MRLARYEPSGSGQTHAVGRRHTVSCTRRIATEQVIQLDAVLLAKTLQIDFHRPDFKKTSPGT